MSAWSSARSFSLISRWRSRGERKVSRRWQWGSSHDEGIRDVDAEGRRWRVESRRVFGVRAHYCFVAGV